MSKKPNKPRPAKTPLKTHGGLHYAAPKLVSLFPPRDSYEHLLDAFCGGLSVTLAHDPDGKAEVVNDISMTLTNFFRCLQRDEVRERLVRWLENTPFSKLEYDLALQILAEPGALNLGPGHALVEWAWAYFVVARQSMAGRMKGFAPLTQTRLRGGMNEQASAWIGAVDSLRAVAERLRRVVILNEDVFTLLPKWDKPRVLVVCDPPWVAETRTAPSVYQHEFTEEQHDALLKIITGFRHASVMVVGRRCPLYDDKWLGGWNSRTFFLANSSASGKEKKRVPCTVWANYPIPEA